MSTTQKILDTPENWENGILGESFEHAAVVSEEETKAIENALGLQMISIRLQRSLLNDLKEIARFHGIGYQPMIRDLLGRFARSELRNVLKKQVKKSEERLKELEVEREPSEPLAPIGEFLERERKRRRA